MKETIKDSAVKGVIWTSLAYAFQRVGASISTLILAAILAPKEFGIIGAAYLAIGALERLSNSGVAAYLIYREERDDLIEQAAFQLSFFIGLLGYALVYYLAPRIALFFNDGSITQVVKIMGLQIILLSLKAVPSAILEKQLAFKERTMPDMIGVSTKVGITIALAIAGYGVWSIVIGLLISESIIVALLFLKTGWRPQIFSFDFGNMKEILSYSKNIQFSGIAIFIVSNMDYSVVGGYLGTFFLGIYTFAFNIANLPATLITQAFSRVLFPAYSKLQTKEDVGRAFLKTTKYISLLAMPVSVGLYYTVPTFLAYVYGDKWNLAVPVLRILIVMGALRSIGSGAGEVFKALGRPDILSKLIVLVLTLGLPALLLWTRHGIIYVGIIMTLVTAVNSTIGIFWVLKLTNTAFSAFIACIKFPLLSSGIMGILLFFLNTGNPLVRMNAFTTLSLSILLGILVYTALILAFDGNGVKEIRREITNGFPKPSRADTVYVKT